MGLCWDDTMKFLGCESYDPYYTQLLSEIRGLPNLGPTNFWKHLKKSNLLELFSIATADDVCVENWRTSKHPPMNHDPNGHKLLYDYD
jgi:hypothetical protein